MGSGGNAGADGTNETYEVREPTRVEFDHCLETGLFTDDPREVTMNMSVVANAQAESTDPAAVGWDQPKWLDMIGSYQQNFPGMALRRFHPKEKGYAAMAQAMARNIAHEYKHNPINPSPPPASASETRSVQIHLRKLRYRYSWFVYDGPQGIPVDPCNSSKNSFNMVAFDLLENNKNVIIDNPPYPGSVSSGRKFRLGKQAKPLCELVFDGSSPGKLKCDDGFEGAFTFDRSWGHGVIMCKDAHSGDTLAWHRA